MLTRISGFMIVKNAVTLGYPFLEAIRAALPVCEEFLVSDGDSVDGTWEALQALARVAGTRLQLYRDPWESVETRGLVLSRMTNLLKGRCRGDYCLNLQANEIVPAESLEELARLPGAFPAADIFRLPFDTFMGPNIIWMRDFRKRLVRNVPWVRSLADAYDLGFSRSELMRRPGVLFRVLLRYRSRRVAAPLSAPIQRFRALCPGNYLRKVERNRSRSGHWEQEWQAASRVLETLEPDRTPAGFYRILKPYFDGGMHAGLRPGLRLPPAIPRRCLGELEHAPSMVAHLEHLWDYDVRTSLAQLSGR